MCWQPRDMLALPAEDSRSALSKDRLPQHGMLRQ